MRGAMSAIAAVPSLFALLVFFMGLLGAAFTIREWWWLYVFGIWVYMAIFPAVEAAEQTIIQRVVPFATQGRVFGFAAMLESAAAPVTAFVAALLAFTTKSYRTLSQQYVITPEPASEN